ncbi:PAS domain-containing protein [Emticicia sp. BO119]|uniref:PAS domain-containing protein n=1 Tax=Emticicia sp. BO119 TaxID=2757768 RepID=UPI0015EFF00A|nr:PAS domain-containing protein [Emticicia sp. BO119]MBA4852796.1 PAS domain-containing protein [Emticicia sp. BO119]
MLNIPAFAYQEEKERPVTAPLLCWDIANPLLEKRIHIQNDIQQIDRLAHRYDWQSDIDFKSLLIESYSVVVTNLSQEIVWVSQSFQSMTGYDATETTGKSPAFLQGEKTNLQTKQFIREKLVKLENIEARILNYRKNGESYWCSIRIFPIQNSQSKVTHYIAIEKEVN